MRFSKGALNATTTVLGREARMSKVEAGDVMAEA